MQSLAKAIRNIEHHAYNYEEIYHIVHSSKQKGVHLRFVNYAGLPHDLQMKHFLPGNFNACFILFKLGGHARETYHWGTMFNSGKGPQFFESFAMGPNQLSMMLQDQGRLAGFLSQHKIDTNRTQLQKKLGTMLTCGAHVACRLVFGWELRNRKYASALKSLGQDTDKTVTLLTALNTWPFNTRPVGDR